MCFKSNQWNISAQLTYSTLLHPSPGSRRKLEGLWEIHWTCDVPFVSHKYRRGVMVDGHQQCGAVWGMYILHFQHFPKRRLFPGFGRHFSRATWTPGAIGCWILCCFASRALVPHFGLEQMLTFLFIQRIKSHRGPEMPVSCRGS